MENEFFSKSILDSCADPRRHWELDDKGHPAQQIIEHRPRQFITPIPKPKKRKGSTEQQQLFDFEEDDPIFQTINGRTPSDY
jgi:type III restriction enzyme